MPSSCVRRSRAWEPCRTPILPIYREKEVGFVVEQLGSEVLIVDGVLRGFDHAAMAESLARRLAPLRALDLSSGLPDGNPADLSAFAEGGADPVRWVLYSSGTTADPKGAKHTDGTLLAASDGFARRLLLRADDQIALVFPSHPRRRNPVADERTARGVPANRDLPVRPRHHDPLPRPTRRHPGHSGNPSFTRRISAHSARTPPLPSSQTSERFPAAARRSPPNSILISAAS